MKVSSCRQRINIEKVHEGRCDDDQEKEETTVQPQNDREYLKKGGKIQSYQNSFVQSNKENFQKRENSN